MPSLTRSLPSTWQVSLPPASFHPGCPTLRVGISELKGTRHNIPKYHIHHVSCPIPHLPKVLSASKTHTEPLGSAGKTCSPLPVSLLHLSLTHHVPPYQAAMSLSHEHVPAMCIHSPDVLPHSEPVTQQMGKTTAHPKELSRSFGVAPDIPAPEKIGLGEGLQWHKEATSWEKTFFIVDLCIKASL